MVMHFLHLCAATLLFGALLAAPVGCCLMAVFWMKNKLVAVRLIAVAIAVTPTYTNHLLHTWQEQHTQLQHRIVSGEAPSRCAAADNFDVLAGMLGVKVSPGEPWPDTPGTYYTIRPGEGKAVGQRCWWSDGWAVSNTTRITVDFFEEK